MAEVISPEKYFQRSKEEEREIEYLRAQIEKLRRMLWKAIVTVGVRMIRRFPASCDSHVIVVRYRHIFRVKYTAWSLKKVVARSVAVSWIIRGKSAAEQLELVSSALKVIRTVRVKKACTKCDCIVEAPASSRRQSAASRVPDYLPAC